MAAYGGHIVAVVKLLCRKGADLNIVDNVIVLHPNLIISDSFDCLLNNIAWSWCSVLCQRRGDCSHTGRSRMAQGGELRRISSCRLT